MSQLPMNRLPVPSALRTAFRRSLPAAAVAGMFLLAASPADAAPLRASILFKGKQASETWYVVAADEKTVTLSASETGAGARQLPRERIDSIALNEPDGWREALTAFTEGRYDIAIRRFGALSREYEKIASIEDGYGARARYYLIESHRLSGDHEAVATEAARLKISPIALGAAYQDQIRLYEAWGQADKEAWLSLAQSLEAFQMPAPDGAAGEEAIARPFREMPASQFVQTAFLRGTLRENTDGKDAALYDYYRAFVLSFGAERELAEESIINALTLLAERPDHETDPRIRREGYSLVRLLKETYGADVPDELEIFTEPPPAVEGEEEGVASAPEAGAAAADTSADDDVSEPEMEPDTDLEGDSDAAEDETEGSEDDGAP